MKAQGNFRFDALSKAVRDRLTADAKLSQRGVGKASRVPHQQISQLLAGQPVGAGTVLKLCLWLDRDPYDFLDFEDQPRRKRPDHKSLASIRARFAEGAST